MADHTTITRRLLNKVVDAFNTGDVSEVDTIFSADYIDHQKPPHIKVDGPEEFKQIVRGARRSEPFHVKILDIVDNGNDKIAARLHWYGNDRGTAINRETLEILRVENGQIVEHWGAETDAHG
jgi:predicted SnoaL-like aldol condensation-catalyzing enzyme